MQQWTVQIAAALARPEVLQCEINCIEIFGCTFLDSIGIGDRTDETPLSAGSVELGRYRPRHQSGLPRRYQNSEVLIAEQVTRAADATRCYGRAPNRKRFDQRGLTPLPDGGTDKDIRSAQPGRDPIGRSGKGEGVLDTKPSCQP